MMKTIFKPVYKAFAVCALAFAVLFASCSDINENEEVAPVAATGKKVSVRITANEEILSRTVFPDKIELDNITNFFLYENEEELAHWTWDADSKISAYNIMQGSPVELEAGKYTLKLVGTTATSSVATDGAKYVGTLKDVEVAEGTVLNFKLFFADVSETGTGTISVRLRYPGINNPYDSYYSYKAELYKTKDKITPDGEAINSSSNFNYYNRYATAESYNTWKVVGAAWCYDYSYTGIDSGYYIIVFSNKYDKALRWTASELVYVTANNTSSVVFDVDPSATYSLTYLPNGGNVNGSTGTAIYLKYSPLEDVELATPSKTNFTFDGWYATEDFSGEPVTGWLKKTVAKDVAVYAKWLYTVSYDANVPEDAEYTGTMESVTKVETEKIKLAKNAFAREGYVFAGWNTVKYPNDTNPGVQFEDETIYPDTDMYPNQKGSCTLYAQWLERTANSVAITFFANGGSLVDVKLVASGTSIEEPETTRTGYDFKGWYTSSDFAEETKVDFTTYAPTADAKLYAKWIPHVYKINYLDMNGEEFSGENKDSLPAGHTYTITTTLVEPVRDEMGFVGWYLNSACTGTAITELSGLGYTDDITLYAKWSRTVFYVSSSGSSSGTGEKDSPLYSIENVTTKIKNANLAKLDYTIKVSGEITNRQNISNLNNNYSTVYAKSLTVTGKPDDENAENAVLIGSTYSSTYSTVYVNSKVPVTLKDITIKGGRTQSAGLGGGITVKEDSILTLGSGVVITDNTASSTTSGIGGGGIYVSGTLIMEDGAEIRNNTAQAYGGAVYIGDNGTFIMNGGRISGNKVTISAISGYAGDYAGGGVFINGSNAVFTMKGGEISENTVANQYSKVGGGGGAVNIVKGTFNLEDGKIIKNSSGYYGGAVSMYSSSAEFNMSGGRISDNTAVLGGGVFCNSGNFVMSGGLITRNSVEKFETTEGLGGGVHNTMHSFTMTGGEISGNMAENANANDLYCNNGVIYLSGDVHFSDDSVLYLPSTSTYIELTGDIESSGIIAKVQPSSYTFDRKLITAKEGVDLEKNLAKFELAPSSDNAPWKLGSDGTLSGEAFKITYMDKGDREFTATNFDDLPAEHLYGRATKLVNPEREGYEFLGWYIDSDCFTTKLTELNGYPYKSDITVYAWWGKKAVSVEIVSGDISIEKSVDEETGKVTLTAASGYTDYIWTINREDAESVIADSSVSDDGTEYTFNMANLDKGRAYTIIVSALGANGIEYSANVQVKK